LGKLIEETASVFWVDLGTGYAAKMRVPLYGSRGWLISIDIIAVTVTVLST